MHRRTYLATTIAAAASLGGCARLPAASVPSTPEGDTSGTPASDPLVESGSGNYPHDVRVDNSLDRDVTLTVTVDRSDARVYRRSHAVAAGTEAVVAGVTAETLPRDDRSLTVTAVDSDGQSATVEVSVSDCLGNVVFYYDPDGALASTYSIC